MSIVCWCLTRCGKQFVALCRVTGALWRVCAWKGLPQSESVCWAARGLWLDVFSGCRRRDRGARPCRPFVPSMHGWYQHGWKTASLGYFDMPVGGLWVIGSRTHSRLKPHIARLTDIRAVLCSRWGLGQALLKHSAQPLLARIATTSAVHTGAPRSAIAKL